MLENVRKRMGREEGFTLVELLVVMLILGILAAIAIPSFLSQRDKAHDADAKASARTAQTAAETYGTDHDGFTGMDEAALIEIEPTLGDTPGTFNAAPGTDPANDYVVSVDSSTGTTFTVTREGGTSTQSCAPDGGGCTDGEW